MGAQASWGIQESASKNKVFFEIEAESVKSRSTTTNFRAVDYIRSWVTALFRGGCSIWCGAWLRPAPQCRSRGNRHGKRIGCEGNSQPESTPARTVRKNQLRCDPHQATRSPSSIPRKSQMYLRVRHMGFSK
jgi:hypothetical protein